MAILTLHCGIRVNFDPDVYATNSRNNAVAQSQRVAQVELERTQLPADHGEPTECWKLEF